MAVGIRIQIDENLLSLLCEMDIYYYIELLVIPTLLEYKELIIESKKENIRAKSKIESKEILRTLLSYKELSNKVNFYKYFPRYDKNDKIEEIEEIINVFHSFLSKGYRREEKILNLVKSNKKNR